MGCPHTCSFCDQRSISGSQKPPSPEQVREICSMAARDIKDKSETEIAFFGGSFTAIERGYMLSLLEATKPFVGEGGFKGIRISTRPDCIDEEILSVLRGYGVTAVELGAQSMSDEVLALNERGHSSEDTLKASALIKSFGFELGLQMMTGLYGSTAELDNFTADEIIKLSPKTVRIYPTAVLEGTRLGELFKSGEYEPMEAEESAKLCAGLLKKFLDNGIRVIRLGLHASELVEGKLIAGTYHPAFRELCEGLIFREEIEKVLCGKRGKFLLQVPVGSQSKAAGHKKSNIEYFAAKGAHIKIKTLPELCGYNIKLSEEVD